MHKTSFVKAEYFYRDYIAKAEGSKPLKILDIGSKIYEGQKSYRDVFTGTGVEYVGLDLEDGENVNIVPANMFLWKEIENESFDFCISGQTFEHNPFFWITFAEIARILKPGGQVLIVAPGRGDVHRYPVDCWRFYPDAWQALCSYTGLDLEESLFEDYRFNHVEEGAEWCDSSLIASKPRFTDNQQATDFYAQLQRITATLPADLTQVLSNNGPVNNSLDSYHRGIATGFWRALGKRLKRRKLSKRIWEYF